MSSEIDQEGAAWVLSAHSTQKNLSPVVVAEVEKQDDYVPMTILSETEEERSAQTTEEMFPDIIPEDGNEDDLVNQSEFTEKLKSTEEDGKEDDSANEAETTEGKIRQLTQVHSHMSPDLQVSTEEPTDEKLHDPDHVTPDEEKGDSAGKEALLEAPRDPSSAGRGGPARAYSPSREEYSLLLQQLNEERANTAERIKKLQTKLAPVLAKKTKEEMERILRGPMQAESYECCLEALAELKERMKEDRATAERRTEELRAQGEEKISKVDKEWEDLLSLKKDVAVTLLNRRLAKSEALARVESALASEQMYQDRLTRVRLHSFSVENRMGRLERELRDADRNATNPFQREYEKLHAKKTERKKYTEKQTEEALRVQRRVERSVQILSDIKKMIQDTEVEVQLKYQELAQVDAIVAQKRETLACVKRARDGLLKDNMRLKENRGLLGNEVLLRDYDHITKARATLEEKMKNLQHRHADLEFYLGRGKRRLEII